MILQNVRVPFVSGLGLPAIFFLGSLAGLVCGRRFNFLKATRDALAEAMPILSILAGVGMFIQVMTLTGARGWAVTTFLVPSARSCSTPASPSACRSSAASRRLGRLRSSAFPFSWPSSAKTP